jgi:hypothetical protein
MELENKQPKVIFSLESRPVTSAQREAGKRLFSRLIDRAQSKLSQNERSAGKDGKKAGRRLPPTAFLILKKISKNSPSLTNRGDSTYKNNMGKRVKHGNNE